VNRFHHFRDGVCSCGDYWWLHAVIIFSFDLFFLMIGDNFQKSTERYMYSSNLKYLNINSSTI
jgi:hypothetical protein